MTSQTLVLDDLPHLAEEVRKTGYRDALSEKQGTIQLDEDADGPPSPPRQKQVTSWQLVKAVWEGRGWVVMTSQYPSLGCWAQWSLTWYQTSCMRLSRSCSVCSSLSPSAS